jgi:hypothetical protein
MKMPRSSDRGGFAGRATIAGRERDPDAACERALSASQEGTCAVVAVLGVRRGWQCGYVFAQARNAGKSEARCIPPGENFWITVADT